MSRAAAAVWASLFVAGVGLLVGAAWVASAQGRPTERGGTLRLVYLQDPGTDPQNGGFSILHATQLTLYSLTTGARDTQILPEAAAGLPVVSRDGRTYTFTIRRGFRFSDGEPVTARNFAFAINRLFNPDLGSVWTFLFEDIVGARDVLERKAATVSGVRVRGEKLIVTLEQARPDFLARLTNPTISATPLDLPIVPGGFRAPAPSAGPYYLREHVPGRRAVFVRNPFWRRDLLPRLPANVDRIVLDRAGLTPEEAIAAVERNEIDFALAQGAPSEAARLIRAYGVNRRRLLTRTRPSVHFLLFNHDRPLFRNNPRLRRAINYALDRPVLARRVAPVQRRTDQVLPPGLPGRRDWRLYPLDGPNVRKARALARGRLRGGKAVFYSREATSGEPFQPRWAEAVKLDLARIGLEVEVHTFPDVNRRLRTPREPWDIAIFGWFADYPDPSNFINELFDGQHIPSGTGGGSNWARFDNPVFNRRMRRAARLSGGERLAAYARIERDLLRTAAPVAPVFLVTDLIFVSTSLGCFTYHPMGFVDLVSVCKR